MLTYDNIVRSLLLPYYIKSIWNQFNIQGFDVFPKELHDIIILFICLRKLEFFCSYDSTAILENGKLTFSCNQNNEIFQLLNNVKCFNFGGDNDLYKIAVTRDNRVHMYNMKIANKINKLLKHIPEIQQVFFDCRHKVYIFITKRMIYLIYIENNKCDIKKIDIYFDVKQILLENSKIYLLDYEGIINQIHIENLHFTILPLQISGKITSFAITDPLMILVNDNGEVFTKSYDITGIGDDIAKKLNIPDYITSVFGDIYHSIFLCQNGDVFGFLTEDFYQPIMRSIELEKKMTEKYKHPTNVMSVVCGEYRTFFLTPEGIYGCGHNSVDQLFIEMIQVIIYPYHV